jgi:hypothetical protein
MVFDAKYHHHTGENATARVAPKAKKNTKVATILFGSIICCICLNGPIRNPLLKK